MKRIGKSAFAVILSAFLLTFGYSELPHLDHYIWPHPNR